MGTRLYLFCAGKAESSSSTKDGGSTAGTSQQGDAANADLPQSSAGGVPSSASYAGTFFPLTFMNRLLGHAVLLDVQTCIGWLHPTPVSKAAQYLETHLSIENVPKAMRARSGGTLSLCLRR